jgi:hypothetical protein
LRDDDGNVFVFPDVTVRAGFYVTVHNCTGQDQIEPKYANLYWGICEQVWDGDSIYLVDGRGQVIFTYP